MIVPHDRLVPNLSFDLVRADEIPAAHELETAAFRADEVSPLEQFGMRQQVASSLFLGAFIPSDSRSLNSGRNIIGFACATRSNEPTLTQESMETHEPKGTSVCIHNVVVSASYQGRGIALALLREYIARVRSDGLTERVLLVCHGKVQRLYEKIGFEYVGPSPVVIGSRQWYEMRLVLKEPPNGKIVDKRNWDTATNLSNAFATLLDKLQSASRRNVITSHASLSSFAGGLDDVITSAGGMKANKFDLSCPRAGCGSVILKAGVGRLVESELPKLEDIEQPPLELLVPVPLAGSIASCWLVDLNPMTFENIGFSRTINHESNNQDERRKLKLLSCAGCDLGPLGWCFEDGNELWLVCERVGYHA